MQVNGFIIPSKVQTKTPFKNRSVFVIMHNCTYWLVLY